MGEYRKTPIQFLADIGFLDDRTPDRPRGLHRRATRGPRHPFGDDLARAGRARRHRRPLPVQVRQDGDDAALVPALPRRRRARSRSAPTPSRSTSCPSCAGRRSWPRSPTATTRPAQHRDVFNAATLGGCRFLAPRRPRPPGPGRQGRHPADQPRPPGRGHVRGSRSRRWSTRAAGRDVRHRHRRRQGAGAGRPAHARGRGGGLRQGARGHAALLEQRRRAGGGTAPASIRSCRRRFPCTGRPPEADRARRRARHRSLPSDVQRLA